MNPCGVIGKKLIRNLRHGSLSSAKDEDTHAVTSHKCAFTFHECRTNNVPPHILRDRKEVAASDVETSQST